MANLVYSARARVSLQSLDDYLRRRDSKVADALLTEIEGLCELIADFPAMGRRLPDIGLRYHVSRKFRYRVIYRYTENTVQILDILHPRATP